MGRVVIPYRHADRVRPYVLAAGLAGSDVVAISVEDRPSLNGADGLILTGGTDVNPRLYGQDADPNVDAPDDLRDEVEWRLIDEALERDLPILAICRGLQLLNVHHGGTLIQHLGSKRHDTEFADKGTVAHDVLVEPESHLESVLGETRVQVNSRHHQAIDRVGEGLRISALDAEDSQMIEGLELPTRRFVLAVQWHPEDQASRHVEQRRIFERFAVACQ